VLISLSSENNPSSENSFRTVGNECRNSSAEQDFERSSGSPNDISEIGCSGPSSILCLPRMVHNPFAVKVGIPTRSMADSTDHKESRPILAPATLVLGRCNNDSENTTNSVSSSFRLKPPILNNPFLKVENSLTAGRKLDGSEVSTTTTREVPDNSHPDTGQEKDSTLSNAGRMKEGPLRKTSLVLENNLQIASTSNTQPQESTTPASRETCAPADNSLTPLQNDNAVGSVHSNQQNASSSCTRPPADEGASFVFGQNMNERVTAVFGSIANGTGEVSFSPGEVAFKGNSHNKEYDNKRSEDAEEAGSDTGGKQFKSLSESAYEYESRQVKRTYEEVAIVTGEEDESNVLQMNCKLFTYDKGTLSWVEKGRGLLRLNDKELEDGSIQSRLIARTQGSLRVVLNTKVWAGMSVDRPSPKSVRLTAMDGGDTMRVFLVSGSNKDIDQLFGALDWRVSTLKSSEDRKAVENIACSILAATSLEPISSASFNPGDETISSSGTSPASPAGATASGSGTCTGNSNAVTALVVTGDGLGPKKRRISPPSGIDEEDSCLGSSSTDSRVQERRVDSTDTFDSNSCDDSNLSFASSSTI